jgi:hypothetical protein
VCKLYQTNPPKSPANGSHVAVAQRSACSNLRWVPRIGPRTHHWSLDWLEKPQETMGFIMVYIHVYMFFFYVGVSCRFSNVFHVVPVNKYWESRTSITFLILTETVFLNQIIFSDGDHGLPTSTCQITGR